MQTEVMRYYGLARPPVDLGFFETEHHAQLTHDLKTAITGGRLIALTATIGSGKTVLTRRLREELEREGRVIVSRALSLEKAKISVPLLVAALFYDLSSEKTVSIPSQSERRERDLQELFRKAKRPVALFVDDAHDLHPKTLTALKRLVELVTEGGGQLAVILVGHPKLRNDLKRPLMEEIGDRTTVFEFGGLRDRQRDYIDWALRTALSPGIEPDAVLTEDAAILLAAKLKTPLQIGRHLVRAFEAGFEASVKPIDAATVEGVLSRQIDDLEPQLTRHGYDTKSLADQFDAKPAEIRQLLRGGLDPARARELTDDMRAAVRHNDEVGSTSALARLHEQRIVSRGDLPRHGVTHRHELDDLAGCELNLCRCAERAPDLDHVSIGVIDLADTSIRTALRRRLRHRRRCRHGADRRGQKQDGLHRVGTSTSARYVLT
ncbi:hypothetical protein S2M10_11000 [Sphingomonas sp. S2M10]|nr:hypothetical protein [Sphingomonas sp. S2M10]